VQSSPVSVSVRVLPLHSHYLSQASLLALLSLYAALLRLASAKTTARCTNAASSHIHIFRINYIEANELQRTPQPNNSYWDDFVGLVTSAKRSFLEGVCKHSVTRATKHFSGKQSSVQLLWLASPTSRKLDLTGRRLPAYRDLH